MGPKGRGEQTSRMGSGLDHRGAALSPPRGARAPARDLRTVRGTLWGVRVGTRGAPVGASGSARSGCPGSGGKIAQILAHPLFGYTRMTVYCQPPET